MYHSQDTIKYLTQDTAIIKAAIAKIYVFVDILL